MPAPMRDSLSRCDSNAYSNLYDVRQSAVRKQEPTVQAAPSTSKDTIEISKEKLKKEALGRLRHQSKYMIIQSSFIRIGEYLFLGLTLPPYLILYGIPKWVLVAGLPALLSVCTEWAGKGGQQIKKWVEPVLHKIASFFQRMQAQCNVLIRPIVRLGLEIQNALQRFKQQVVSVFNQWTQYVKHTFKRKDQKNASFLKRSGTVLGNAWTQVRQSISKQMAGLAESWQLPSWQEKVQGMRKGIKNKIFRLFSNRVVSSFSNQFSLRLHQSQVQAEHLSKWIFKQFGACQQGLVRVSQLIKGMYQELAQPIFRRASTFIRSKWSSVKEFCGQGKRRLFHFLQEGQFKLKHLKSEHLLAQLSSRLSLSWLPLFLREAIKKLLDHQIFRKGLQIVITGLYIGFSFFSGVVRWLFEAFHVTQSSIAKGIKMGMSWMQRGGAIGINYINKPRKTLQRGGFKAIYHTLVCLIMLGFLTLWGCQLVNRVVNRLLFKRDRNSSDTPPFGKRS